MAPSELAHSAPPVATAFPNGRRASRHAPGDPPDPAHRGSRPRRPPPPTTARFADQLDAFAAADRNARSPMDALFFVGSSTIRLRPDLARRFRPTAVVQRGVGGATLAEALRRSDVLFAPHRPRAIVLDAGGRTRPELFLPDGLPVDAPGYAELTRAVKAALARAGLDR